MKNRIKMGGVCFTSSYILSFESKEEFLKANENRQFHNSDKSRRALLSQMWDDLHKEIGKTIDLKVSKSIEHVDDKSIHAEDIQTKDQGKKSGSKKRKAENKKE